MHEDYCDQKKDTNLPSNAKRLDGGRLLDIDPCLVQDERGL